MVFFIHALFFLLEDEQNMALESFSQYTHRPSHSAFVDTHIYKGLILKHIALYEKLTRI